MRVPFVYLHKNGLPNLDAVLKDVDVCAELYKLEGVRFRYDITIGVDNVIVLFTLIKEII